MLRIKLKKAFVSCLIFLAANNCFSQTFSQLSENNLPNLYQHLLVNENRIITVGWGYMQNVDSFELTTEARVRDLTGELVNSIQYQNTDWFWDPAQDCNTILNDSTFVLGIIKTDTDNDTVFNSILFLNEAGDTIQSWDYVSPYFTQGQISTYHHVPAAITIDSSGENFFIVSRVVDYPPIQNNFIIRKINAEGEVLWTYINPIDEWYYSANDLTFKNDTLWFISIASGNLGHYNKLMGLSPDSGEVIFEVEHNGASFPVGGCEDMILTDDGPVIANTIGDSDGTLPFLYKMDFAGNYIWQAQPLGDFAYDQTNNHLVQSSDGGFVSCGEKYDEEPSWLYPNDPAMNNTMKRIWLWKVDADGNFLWQRFYAYYDFDYSEEYFHLTNIAHDMKATPDGGFIMAGEASASCTNYPTCDEFTQQGWLLKVDGCGCLVPGCDPGCIVGIEEIAAEDEIKYFRFGPNPVSDMLNVHIPSLSIPMSELTFSLYDNLGRKVNDFQFKYDDTTYMIDASNLASGEYILLLSQSGKTLQCEVIIVQ